MVHHLFNTHKTLNSIPSTAKTEEEDQEEVEMVGESFLRSHWFVEGGLKLTDRPGTCS